MKAITTLIFSALTAVPLFAAFPAGGNNFSAAGVIPSTTTQSLSTLTPIDTFTAEAGEPDFTTVKHTAWWKWTSPAKGWVTFHAGNNPSANPVVAPHLAVFTGSAIGNLVLLNRTASTIDSEAPKVTVYVAAGATIHIQYDSRWAGHYGEASLGFRFLPAEKLNVNGCGEAFRTSRYSLNMTSLGVVTGSLSYGSGGYSFKGTAGADGFFTAMIPRSPINGQPVVPLQLVVDLVPDSSMMHRAWIQDGLISPELIWGVRTLTFTVKAPQPLAPRFTAVINHPAGIGRGYFTAKISPLGVVTLAGRMGDGNPFTSVSPLGKSNPSQYHATLGRGAGKFTGLLQFQDMNGSSDTVACVDGYYVRPANATSEFYKNGIYAGLSVTGSAYKAPTSGQRALDFLKSTNGMGNLFLEGAMNEYMDTTIAVNFTTTNRFVFSMSQNKPALRINPQTGVVSGSAEAPVGKTRTLRGILIMDGSTPRVRGHVTGKTITGAFSVIP